MIQLRSVALLLAPLVAAAAQPGWIELVDRENGWPVPLVEMRTIHGIRKVSDNLGLIAIDEADLLDREIYYYLRGHGYGVPKDGFGYEGVRITLKSGGKQRIELDRRAIAKRLGRLTGGGLFAEGEKLGISPLLPESGIFGCDSVQMAREGDELFWLWGDTNVPSYPLGVFHMTAATTPAEVLTRFRPPLALPFTHFRDTQGRPRAVANLPGEGPTWLGGLVIFPRGHRAATYAKIRPPLDEYEIGLCVWSPGSEGFTPQQVLWKSADGPQPTLLRGHPVRWQDSEGKRWLLFGDPFPSARCPDHFESWKTRETWEKVTPPAHPHAHDDGQEVRPHRGSIAWSPFRNRWVAIFTQHSGKPSAFGEIWYAEAESPFGPWHKLVKVLSHDRYTFYNPRIHSELTPEGASFILFEGTYTALFADEAQPTPRHDYNQILYRLDLDDLRLKR